MIYIKIKKVFNILPDNKKNIIIKLNVTEGALVL